MQPTIKAKEDKRKLKAIVTKDGYVYFASNKPDSPLYYMDKLGEVHTTCIFTSLEGLLARGYDIHIPVYEGDELTLRF